MLDGGTRSASVETLAESELLALPGLRRAQGDRRPRRHRREADRGDHRRLREPNERVARQSFQTVPSRVAGVLSQLIAEETIPERRQGITVRMTQADLAQLAGASRASVSRFLATLERAGVVAVGAPGHRARAPCACAPTSSEAGRPAVAELERRRARMVERHLRAPGVADERVLEAMGSVPRERVRPGAISPPRLRRLGAADRGRTTISQPWIVAAICQALRLRRRRGGARGRNRLGLLGRGSPGSRNRW